VAAGSATTAVGDPPIPDPGALAPLGSDVQHLHFRYGPLHIPAGQNLILAGPVTIEKPAYDGYVIAMKPNLVGPDGVPPGTDVVHLHHGVFLNLSRSDSTARVPERFSATGEEKTTLQLPYPYGYFVRGSDVWALNYMIHNQTPQEQTVWLTYDVDYVPASSALGRQMKPARPIWMDVQDGKAYPVFDVHRGSGANGAYTYPEDARPYPYGHGAPLNEWTAPRDGTLIGAVGHVHPGGLYDDLDVIRAGASPRLSTVVCRASKRRRARRRHHAARSHAARRRRHRRAAARRTCSRRATGIIAGHEPGSVRLFRSSAHYFDPAGPISWDLAMLRTPNDWRVTLKKGDRLAISAAYDTTRASWYESMGIMVAYMADDRTGADPYTTPVDQNGFVTHGHLAENDNHGGLGLPGAVNPATAPDGRTLANGVAISAFNYLPGSFGLPGAAGLPPVIQQGQQLRFGNFDAAAQIFHTITACRLPCNRSTGLDYPLANGPIDFDSGDLGSGPRGYTAAAQREDWSTPANLPPGTYTYFCRIHPFMRGSFRVVVR